MRLYIGEEMEAMAMATRWQSVLGRPGLRSRRLGERESSDDWTSKLVVKTVRLETLSAHGKSQRGMRLCGNGRSDRLD
jgi:hypothetical protein